MADIILHCVTVKRWQKKRQQQLGNAKLQLGVIQNMTSDIKMIFLIATCREPHH